MKIGKWKIMENSENGELEIWYINENNKKYELIKKIKVPELQKNKKDDYEALHDYFEYLDYFKS